LKRSSLLFLALLVGVAVPCGANETCPTFEPASEGLGIEAEWRTYPKFVDFNHDGHLDLIGHPRKGPSPGAWLGDGRGNWKLATEGLILPGFPCGVGVDAADVNSDGNIDLAIADHCRGLFVFLGDGEGGWKLGPLVDAVETGGREDLALGDLDGDGDVDLVAIGSYRGGIQYYAGDGRGGFKRAERGLPKIGMGREVVVADVNADGRLDIAASFRSGEPEPNPVLWLSNGSGNFHPVVQDLPDDGNFWQVSVGDVNGDGLPDLAASSDYVRGRPPLLVYLQDAAGGWSLAVEGLPPPVQDGHLEAFHGVALADFNGDTHLDLVAVDWAKAGLRLWLGDGSGRWSECPKTGLPEGHERQFGYGVAARDVNGDGKPDLAAAFGRAPRGSLQVWVQK